MRGLTVSVIVNTPFLMNTAACDLPIFWRSCPEPAVRLVRPDWCVMDLVGSGDDVSADQDLAACVAAARRQDHSAFAELVRRYKSRVFALASRFARNTPELEDLCQEIFIQAYQKLDTFRGESPFEHWLTRIAVRKCYDLLRRTRHERQASISLEAVHRFVEDEAASRDSQAREAREIIHRALAELSPDERLILTLLELEDQPVREIAAATGWSEANVRTRAFRARASLKQILQRQHPEHP